MAASSRGSGASRAEGALEHDETGSPVHGPDAAARTDLRGNGHCDTRPWHWRQLGDLQRRGRRPFARCSCCRSRQPRRRLYDIRQHPVLTLVLSRLFRFAGQWDVCVPGGLYGGVRHAGCERSAGASRRRARQRQLLRRSWHHDGHRSRLRTGRRSHRVARSRGGHLACALAAAVQRRPVVDRPDDPSQQQPVHAHRRRTTWIRRSSSRNRDGRLGSNRASARSGSGIRGSAALAWSSGQVRPAQFTRIENGRSAAAWRQHRGGGVAR